MATKKNKKPVQVSSELKGQTARPPAVAFVGHIDHGKTSLLDKIRQSNTWKKESGGITQHIGASQITFLDKDKKEQKITFIDTPGHATFTKMRARGVEVTDLVVLVVAADSGVQEQTKESISHVKAAGVPFLVAINKTDLPTADIEKVKGQLAEVEVIPESYGGDIVVMPVSAKTGDGIKDLLEMITLMAELLELKADISADVQAVVIESTLDKRKGCLATVLVRQGTIHRGDRLFVEKTEVKVKQMTNWQGEQVDQALPGDPVEILGFCDVPAVGSLVSKKPKKPSKKSAKKEVAEQKKSNLKLVVKADVGGSLEALLAGLPDEVKVIHSGVGEISDNDVFLAQTTGAEIIGFNVKISSAASRVAEQSGVKVALAKIIYELFEIIEKKLKDNFDPLEGKEILGKAKISAEFKIGGKRIAGGKVFEGELNCDDKVMLMRNKEVVDKTVLASLRHMKEVVVKAEKGVEFGAVFSPPVDFNVGDVIISYNDGESD